MKGKSRKFYSTLKSVCGKINKFWKEWMKVNMKEGLDPEIGLFQMLLFYLVSLRPWPWKGYCHTHLLSLTHTHTYKRVQFLQNFMKFISFNSSRLPTFRKTFNSALTAILVVLRHSLYRTDNKKYPLWLQIPRFQYFLKRRH